MVMSCSQTAAMHAITLSEICETKRQPLEGLTEITTHLAEPLNDSCASVQPRKEPRGAGTAPRVSGTGSGHSDHQASATELGRGSGGG